MPISFIFGGIILLCVLFNIFQFRNKFQKYFLLCVLLFFEVSFFADMVEVFDIYFNIWQLIILLCALVYFLSKYYRKIFCILFSLFLNIAYYLLLKCNLISFLSIETIVFACSIISCMSFKRYYLGLFTSLLSTITLTFINVYFELTMFTFDVANFNAIFDGLLVYSIFYLIKNLFLQKIKFGGNDCVIFKNEIYKKNHSFSLFFN